MNPQDVASGGKLPRAGEIAGYTSDPRFYSALKVLPNPDPILRKLGASEDVFASIASDAHVKGELRAVRSGLTRFEHKLLPGGDDRASKKAFQIVTQYLANSRPAPHYRWPDVFWNIGKAVFQGFSVHEIVPGRFGDLLLPAKLLERPTRRFRFEPNAETLRVLTRDQMIDGVDADQELLLVARHMPSYDQPYGEALFASCFWPYTFKHLGFKAFVKFTERHGLPIPVASYDEGTPTETIDKIEEALAALIDAGYIVKPGNGSVELLEAAGASGGNLVQKELIQVCNGEMSKVLTSQTLATEQIGSGSRAASETHRGREEDVQDSDRELIAHTLDQLWALITLWNVPGAKPPTSEFMEESEVRYERAQIYDLAIKDGLPVSKKGMAQELAIKLADPGDPEDRIQAPAPTVPPAPGADPNADPAAQFAAAADVPADQAAIDQALDALLQGDQSKVLQPILKPLLQLAQDHPEQLLGKLAELYPQMDPQPLAEKITRMLFVAQLWGSLSAQLEG